MGAASSKRNARAAEPTAAQGGGASPQRSATTALASLGAALHLPHAKDPFADTPRHVAKVEGTLVGKSGSAVEKVTEGLVSLTPSGFSSDTIVIEVVAPSVPDLTLIDLPGLVRTVTEGQNPQVIVEVNNLIEAYLAQSRTIILAVVPSNVDVATVDILERAQNVDPTGERTIGVLTKPDLIDRGSEAEVVQVLTNVRKPLKLG